MFDAKIAESGITSDSATACGLRWATPGTLFDLGIKTPNSGGLLIPYPDTDFFRVRFLPAAKSKKGKELRYSQPFGTGAHAYLPPLMPWPTILADPSLPLIITEGELKAVKSCQEGFPTIGLGGVSMWRDKLHPYLPVFDTIAWEGRPTYIVFDSDSAKNPQVMREQISLARLLKRNFKASVRIVRLPALPDEKKCGLDDFLVHHSKDELANLLDATPPYDQHPELERLNDEVIYIEDPGCVMEVKSGRIVPVRDFIAHLYAPRKIYEVKVTGTKVTQVEKSAAAEWIKWDLRSSVSRMDFLPGEPLFCTDKEPHDTANTWRKWGCDPLPGAIDPWNQLMESMFRGDNIARTWFEDWLSYPLQYPGTKLATACCFWGVATGTGKSSLGYTMGRIYGSAFVELDYDTVFSGQVTWIDRHLFALGDELTGGQPRRFADRIKNFITRNEAQVNIKYIPIYTCRDKVNYLFTSQHPDAFYVEDDDRRLFIWEVTEGPGAKWFRDEYYPWLHGRGASHLFHYFLARKISEDWHPKAHAYRTSARSEMVEASRSELDTWVQRIKESPTLALQRSTAPLWTAEDLHAVMPVTLHNNGVTPGGVSRALKRAGFQQVSSGNPIKLSSGERVRLWNIGGLTVECNYRKIYEDTMKGVDL